MVVVAIAGGTSPTLGKSLVTAILATGKHEVVIFSRKPEQDDPTLPSTKYGAPIHYTHYTDTLTHSLSSTLSTLQVHTLLSVLKVPDPNEMQRLHQYLLHAAIASGTVRRYAPSDWSMGHLTHKSVEMLGHKDTLLSDAQSIVAEQKADIEVCTFQNGMFMEYLAQDLPNPNDPYKQISTSHQPKATSDSTSESGGRSDVLLSGLRDDLMLEYIAIANGKLVVPLDASGKPARISTTSIRDIGRFVAAALDLEAGAWDGYMGIVGANITFAEVKDLLKQTNAPEIKDEVVTREDCDEVAARFGEELGKGFSLEAFLKRMVAQMMGASCGVKLGEGIVEGKLNRLLEERGWRVEGRDVGGYLREVWGENR